ncbi:MAG: CRISPR-associated endonuclease Cas2 [Sarcina sp.]
MSYRYMRVIVFFDLPVVLEADRKEYLRFKKFLINDGFSMMQESVYTKITLNTTAAKLVENRVQKQRTKKGLIQLLTVTEKQFASMKFITGSCNNNLLNNDSRLVIF